MTKSDLADARRSLLEEFLSEVERAIKDREDEIVRRSERSGGSIGSVSNFVFKAVLIRPGLLRQGEKNRLTAPSPG